MFQLSLVSDTRLIARRFHCTRKNFYGFRKTTHEWEIENRPKLCERRREWRCEKLKFPAFGRCGNCEKFTSLTCLKTLLLFYVHNVELWTLPIIIMYTHTHVHLSHFSRKTSLHFRFSSPNLSFKRKEKGEILLSKHNKLTQTLLRLEKDRKDNKIRRSFGLK